MRDGSTDGAICPGECDDKYEEPHGTEKYASSFAPSHEGDDSRDNLAPSFIEQSPVCNLQFPVVKATATAAVSNVQEIPNGGVRAWMQVVGSFFIFFNTWGTVNTFGTYQTYYETGILSSSSPSDLAWIGSIQAFMLMLIGSITGPVYDAGYVRHLILAGTFMAVFGQMMLSLCTSYWQVLLAQGFCVGMGLGLLFVPGVAILSTYFSTRIATATGLAAAGSSIGGVLYPIIFYQLQPQIGFAWTVRVLGFVKLSTLLISVLTLRVRMLPPVRRKLIDWTAFRDLPWLFFSFGCSVAFTGLYAPFFYVQSYVIAKGIMQPDLAFYLLSMINAASTFGRIIPGFVGDIVGPMNVIIPCAAITGALCLCFIGATSSASVIVCCCLYGFFSGTMVSLPPTIYVRMTKDRALIGTRIGMGFAITSVGLLIGTPISGVILNASGFQHVWIFGGVVALAGTCLIAASRVTQRGFQVFAKV